MSTKASPAATWTAVAQALRSGGDTEKFYIPPVPLESTPQRTPKKNCLIELQEREGGGWYFWATVRSPEDGRTVTELMRIVGKKRIMVPRDCVNEFVNIIMAYKEVTRTDGNNTYRVAVPVFNRLATNSLVPTKVDVERAISVGRPQVTRSVVGEQRAEAEPGFYTAGNEKAPRKGGEVPAVSHKLAMASQRSFTDRDVDLLTTTIPQDWVEAKQVPAPQLDLKGQPKIAFEGPDRNSFGVPKDLLTKEGIKFDPRYWPRSQFADTDLNVEYLEWLIKVDQRFSTAFRTIHFISFRAGIDTIAMVEGRILVTCAQLEMTKDPNLLLQHIYKRKELFAGWNHFNTDLRKTVVHKYLWAYASQEDTSMWRTPLNVRFVPFDQKMWMDPAARPKEKKAIETVREIFRSVKDLAAVDFQQNNATTPLNRDCKWYIDFLHDEIIVGQLSNLHLMALVEDYLLSVFANMQYNYAVVFNQESLSAGVRKELQDSTIRSYLTEHLLRYGARYRFANLGPFVELTRMRKAQLPDIARSQGQHYPLETENINTRLGVDYHPIDEKRGFVTREKGPENMSVVTGRQIYSGQVLRPMEVSSNFTPTRLTRLRTPAPAYRASTGLVNAQPDLVLGGHRKAKHPPKRRHK